MGKNCALGLEYGPRPAASGRTQDLGHSFFSYGLPARKITYIYIYYTLVQFVVYIAQVKAITVLASI